MTKLQHLKRKLIRILMIFAAVLAAMAVVSYVSSDYAAKKGVQVRQEQSNINVYHSRIEQLEQKFNIYETSFSAYTELDKKLKEGRFKLDTAEVKKILNRLRQQHRIANLTLQMTPQNRYGQEDPSSVGVEPVFREVTLSLSALSDLHIYAFLQDLERSMPGYMHFTKATVTRIRPLSDDILREVSVGSTPALVSGNITFVWLGITQKKSSATEGKGTHAMP